jgi:PilZ domain
MTLSNGRENRKFTRRAIDLVVQIESADGSNVNGVLLDLSEGGVRLKVSNPDSLPEHVVLKLSDKVHRWSRIAWRSAEEIGAEFVSAQPVTAESETRRLVLIKCPRTGRDISTGIQLTTASDLSKLSSVRRFSQCPSCRVVHGWTPNEASVMA